MHGTQKTDRPLPGFVGGTLDRVDHVRTNPVLLGQAFADPAARRLVLDGLEPVEADGHLLLEPIDSGAVLNDHVLLGVDRVLAALEVLARSHARTPMVGRNHGIHAEPTTFGLKMALMYDEFGRAQERLERARLRLFPLPPVNSTRPNRTSRPAAKAKLMRGSSHSPLIIR